MIALLKIFTAAILIWISSEAGKRSGTLGALWVSLPLTSIFSLCFVWFDTKNPEKISTMSTEVLWFLLPSCSLFIALPLLLKRGLAFPLAMGFSILITAASYAFLFKLRA